MRTTELTAPKRLPFALSPRFGLKLAAGVCVIVVATIASGANPLASPVPPEQVTDDKLAVRIQAAIANDPDLKKLHLNLLVNVVDRSAVIGGPISDRAFIPKIEAVARAVSGVSHVKVSLWVPAGANQDPLARKVAEAMAAPQPKKLPPPPRPAEPPFGGSTVPPLGGEPAPIPVLSVPPPIPLAPLPVEPQPAPVLTPPAVVPPVASPVIVHRQPGSLLLEPVAPGTTAPGTPASVPGAAPLPYKTIPPTRVPTVPATPNGLPDIGWAPEQPPVPSLEKPQAKEAGPLAEAIADLRRRDARFAELQVEIRGAVAIIRGKAASDAVPWEFAAQVRKQPGVERVILGQVDVK